MSTANAPIAILGAGPIGLAAASHLHRLGLSSVIFECGATVGHNIGQWGHVRLFTPWSMNIDEVAAQFLDATGWQRPAEEQHPTGTEFIRDYLAPLAEQPFIAEQLVLNTRVLGVARARHDLMKSTERDSAPFVVRVADSDGVRDVTAAAVIDATGTFQQPAGLGCHGLAAIAEAPASDRIDYGIPDVAGSASAHYAGQRTLVVGGGHSAYTTLNNLVSLADTHPDTGIYWAVRRPSLDGLFDGAEDDPLPERGQLARSVADHIAQGRIEVCCDMQITNVERMGDAVRVSGYGRATPWTDRIVAATGLRPDTSLLAETRIALDPGTQSPVGLAPLVDPNVHTCGSVADHGEPELRHPEAGLYIVGIKSYGRAPTFLLRTGYQQVASVAAALADTSGQDSSPGPSDCDS